MPPGAAADVRAGGGLTDAHGQPAERQQPVRWLPGESPGVAAQRGGGGAGQHAVPGPGAPSCPPSAAPQIGLPSLDSLTVLAVHGRGH